MRRFMTQYELARELDEAITREEELAARFHAAKMAAEEPARQAEEAERRERRAQTPATKAATRKETERLAEIALPLIQARDEAFRALTEASAYTDELRQATEGEWKRVQEGLNDPRNVAKFTSPCPGSKEGNHNLGIGSTYDGMRQLNGLTLHCSRCGARAVIAESQAVQMLLAELVDNGVIHGLPKLACTR